MPVKRSQSAARMLKVFEEIAQRQPIGVSELAKQLDADKSAVQRDIMTLADSGWIQATFEKPTRWALTSHILSLAQFAHDGQDLRVRARSTLEAVHKECGETVLLVVPEAQQFVVIDLVESTHFLRTTAYVGLVIPATGSATCRAMLPFMDEQEQIKMLGIKPDGHMRKQFTKTIECGYAVSVGVVYSGSTNIAAPIFDTSGKPIAAIVISAPSERVPKKYHDTVGNIARRAADKLSQAKPAIST